MTKLAGVRFRKDLTVLPTGSAAQTKRYLIKDPASGETFEFGEEEYFLCNAIDGVASKTEIIAEFEQRFKIPLTHEGFDQFFAQIAKLGLIEAGEIPLIDRSSDRLGDRLEGSNYPAPALQPPKSTKSYQWSFFNPNALFHWLAQVLSVFSPVYKLLTWALIPGIILAILTLWNNRFLFWDDTVLLLDPIPFLKQFSVDVIIINLASKILQGIVCAGQGGTVSQIGLTLGFGFLPYFYISKESFWTLSRQQQLWVFGTPLIYRLALVVSSIVFWSMTRGAGEALTTGSLALFHASLIGLLMDGNPFWPGDGYGWLINLFRLPPTSIGRAFRVWGMMFDRRPLPRQMSLGSRVVLILYALAIVAFWLLFFVYAGVLIAAYLERNFRGSGVLLFLVLFGLFGGWCWWVTQRFGVKPNPAVLSPNAIPPQASPIQASQSEFRVESMPRFQPDRPTRKSRRWGRWLRWGLLVVAIVVLCLPYQYHAGGELKLLPPKRQEIVSEIDAYVRQVRYAGADGAWITAKTVIAELEAADIQNAYNTAIEQLSEQEAILQRQQATLDKLIAVPRIEEVELAQERVEISRAELDVAQKRLEASRVQAESTDRRAQRFAQLYNEGAIARQTLEDAQRQSDTDRADQSTAESNVLTAMQELREAEASLSLVQSGSFPQDIEAARQEMAATRAKMRQLEQSIRYFDTQLQHTEMLMPFDGTLITPFLDQKVGSYLEEGDVFAVAEDHRNMRGEVLVPEFQVNEVIPDRPVEARLLTYPNVPLSGTVIAIAPTADELSYGRVIRVLVEFPNPENLLKSGMTGHAKIAGSTMPVIVAFTRAIVRFVLIEIWSWFP